MKDNRIKYLNALYPIENILGTDKKQIKCDFHDDRSPSAHIYENRIWCFRCGKFYYVASYIKLWKLNVDTLWAELIQTYGSEEKIKESYQFEESPEKRDLPKLRKSEDFKNFFKNYFNL